MRFDNNTIFCSKRSDGLGERLRALLNAFALSKRFNAKFLFNWPERLSNNKYHSISRVDDIFSRDFIEKYHVDISGLRHSKEIDGLSDSTDIESGLFNCNQSLSSGVISCLYTDYSDYRMDVKAAFSEISFSDKVNETIKLAEGVDLMDGCSAVHLRGGDLVSGSFRQNICYVGKTIPYYIVSRYVREKSDSGFIIFDQDALLHRILHGGEMVKFSDYFKLPGFDKLQNAFFDIVLMSRCRKIYSGHSGFAILAGMIGGSGNSSFNYSKEKILKIAYELSEDHTLSSDLHTSFFYKYVLFKCFDILSYEDVKWLAMKGSSFDASNLVFDFFDAWNEYKNGNPLAADNLVGNIFNKNDLLKDFFANNFGSKWQAIVMRRTFNVDLLEPHIERFNTNRLYCSMKEGELRW